MLLPILTGGVVGVSVGFGVAVGFLVGVGLLVGLTVGSGVTVGSLVGVSVGTGWAVKLLVLALAPICQPVITAVRLRAPIRAWVDFLTRQTPLHVFVVPLSQPVAATSSLI